MRLSYSKIDRFQKCKLSYRYHYIDDIKEEPSSALMLGKAVHAALEAIYKDAQGGSMDGEHIPPWLVKSSWGQAYGKSGLTDEASFEDGQAMLLKYFEDVGPMQSQEIYAVESGFTFPAGDHEVVGFIDRIKKDADGADGNMIVIDYKTNRAFMGREEVEQGLQLSIYALAANLSYVLKPKNLTLQYWMLRHGEAIRTTRTDEQMEATLNFLSTIGDVIAETKDFPPSLSSNCAWCGYRKMCPAWHDAGHGYVEPVIHSGDIDGLCKEREGLAAMLKAVEERKKELDGHIKRLLDEQPELVSNGVKYVSSPTRLYTYPLTEACDRVAQEMGLEWVDVVRRVAEVSNTALKNLLDEYKKEHGAGKLAILKAELENMAEVRYQQRLTAKKQKGE